MKDITHKQIIVSFVSHSSRMDGAERSLLDLLDGLKSRGVSCHVILPDNGPLENELKRRSIPYNILYYRWWTMNEGEDIEKVESEICLQVTEIVTLLEGIDPDLIYTNTSVINVGALAAKILGKPHIWHIREFGEIDHNLKFILPIEDRSGFIYENSACVIFNSKAVEKYYGGIKGKSVVIYNNVTIDSTISNKGEVNNPEIFKKKESHKIVVVGTVHEGKNQEDAVYAVKNLVENGVDVELVIVGNGEAKYVEKLKRVICDNKLVNNITFLGYVLEPYNLFKSADVVVVCSKSEAFGRVVIEGMLFKKPVIAARGGGIPEIIDDKVNGLLYTTGKPDELAEKLKFVFDNKHASELYAKNGYDFAIKNFSDEKYSGEIKNIFGTLKKSFVPALSSLYTKIWRFQRENIKRRDDDILKLLQSVSEKEEIIKQKDREIVNLNEIILQRDVVINAIYNSTSWRITYFLRVAKKIVKKIGRSIKKIFGIVKNTVYINLEIFLRKTNKKEQKLIMTLLVRDEADIVEANIKFHLAHGVDFIIATDNGSIDGTREILAKYEKMGKLLIIDETSHDYSQADWVNRMGKMAFDTYNAGYVFHCDADEFWYSKSGNLKTEIMRCNKNVIVVDIINVLLVDKGGKESFPYDTKYAVVKPFVSCDLEKDSLEKNLYIFKYPPKVIFRKNFRVEQGNHDVVNVSEKNKCKSNDIVIYHYPIRSKNHFFMKVKNGGAAYNANKKLNKKIGWHWRRWYESFANGTLEDEYKKLIFKTDEIEELKRKNLVEEVLFETINKYEL